MHLSAELLLILFIGITALSMTLQALAVWRAAQTVRKMAEELQQETRKLQAAVESVSSKLTQVSESLEPVRQLGNEFNDNVRFVMGAFRRTTEEVDGLVKEVIRLGHEQAQRVDGLVTDTVEKFDQTSEVIQKDVLKPILEIGSFFKGVQSGLSFLLGRRGKKTGTKSSEEELFI